VVDVAENLNGSGPITDPPSVESGGAEPSPVSRETPAPLVSGLANAEPSPADSAATSEPNDAPAAGPADTGSRTAAPETDPFGETATVSRETGTAAGNKRPRNGHAVDSTDYRPPATDEDDAGDEEQGGEAPLARSTVSRETLPRRLAEPRLVPRDAVADMPIAREAAAALQVLNLRKEVWPAPAATRIMTVANQKGGVGKTTTAVNVAATLALHGLRVLVIDLDPQGNASTALGVDHSVGTPSIYDALLGGRPLDELATSVPLSDTLRCIPATIDLAGSEIELTSQVAREFRLQRAIEAYSAEVDYVFIDCPPSLGLLTLNALVAAREVLIPIQCEYYALEGLAQLLSTIDLVRAHLNPSIAVSTVVLTMYDSRTRLADQVADEVRHHFGDLVLESVIPRNVRVSEAPGFGQTVITYDPGSRGAISYVDAAREIAERGRAGGPTVTSLQNEEEAR
jgi:chromosome partitioning protein